MHVPGSQAVLKVPPVVGMPRRKEEAAAEEEEEQSEGCVVNPKSSWIPHPVGSKA